MRLLVDEIDSIELEELAKDIQHLIGVVLNDYFYTFDGEREQDQPFIVFYFNANGRNLNILFRLSNELKALAEKISQGEYTSDKPS